MKPSGNSASAILALLVLRPLWAAYDLTQQVRRNMRYYWPRAESHLYAEAKRLAGRRLVRTTDDATGRRGRTLYEITAAGRRELAKWLASPPRPTTLECEPLLRVLVADHATPDQVLAALDRLRVDAEEILSIGRVVGREYIEGNAPFQDQVHVRALVHEFLSGFAIHLRTWADQTERRYRGWADLSKEARARQAVAQITATLRRYPEPPPPEAAAPRR